MKGIGIVFSSAGGKIAYEIDVWKFFHEIGLDQYARCVSGTSAGALNATLFSRNSFEISERIRRRIESRDVLSMKKIKPENGVIMNKSL